MERWGKWFQVLFLCSDLPFIEHNVGSGWYFVMRDKITAGLCREDISPLSWCTGLKREEVCAPHVFSQEWRRKALAPFYRRVTNQTSLQISENWVGWSGIHNTFRRSARSNMRRGSLQWSRMLIQLTLRLIFTSVSSLATVEIAFPKPSLGLSTAWTIICLNFWIRLNTCMKEAGPLICSGRCRNSPGLQPRRCGRVATLSRELCVSKNAG